MVMAINKFVITTNCLKNKKDEANKNTEEENKTIDKKDIM